VPPAGPGLPGPAPPRRPRLRARAQAKGLAAAQNQFLKGASEEADADELRAAVSDALCRSQQRLAQFKEVVPSIEAVEGGMTKCAGARARAAASDGAQGGRAWPDGVRRRRAATASGCSSRRSGAARWRSWC
jgi:hypothetical protein